MNEGIALKALLTPEKKITSTLPIDRSDSVLILSPHPDDETLGCGGAIIKMISSSVNVTVAMLTDGNGGGRLEDISRIRKKEFMEAKSVLGYSTFDILGYPDGKLALYQEELSEQIRKILCKQSPKLVLTPYLLDYAIDHRATNTALAQALKNLVQIDIVVGMYEIWTPITNPSCYLNITDEYSQKRIAMQCYHSQEEYFGIIDKSEILSVFRAKLSMRKRVKYMECFKFLNAKEYINMIESWNKFQCQEERSEI